ncbi:MAG: siroheme synthase [Sphingomonadales bacterium]|nr:MAG: siroheme synthase [Sphingomonadales bacterium]
MINSLPLFHRISGQRVLVLGDGDAAEPKRRLVERAGGVVIADAQQAMDEGVRLAFIAYEDAGAGETAAKELKAAGMLVNVVDRPALCDFTTPSILDRDPVLIAVGTGGASAGLAKHIRLRLERILPQTLGALASALYAARDGLRARLPDPGERRRALDEALREGGTLDPFSNGSSERVDSWVRDESGPVASATETIELASADPEDLTLRQARLLGEADTILNDGNVPEAILARARADAIRCEYSGSPDLGSYDGKVVILRYRQRGN